MDDDLKLLADTLNRVAAEKPPMRWLQALRDSLTAEAIEMVDDLANRMLP